MVKTGIPVSILITFSLITFNILEPPKVTKHPREIFTTTFILTRADRLLLTGNFSTFGTNVFFSIHFHNTYVIVKLQ